METTAGDLEERRVAVEEKKIELEHEKIRTERLRAWYSSFSIFGSLFVVAGTVALGIWSQYEQSKLQHSLQDRQAKAQFELKAAEIVMDTNDPGVTRNKARALQALFPQYLSDNFADSFSADAFARAETETAPVPTDVPLDVIQLRAASRTPSRSRGNVTSAPGYTFNGDRPRVYRPRPSPTPLPVDSNDEGDAQEEAARAKPSPTRTPSPPTP